MVPWLSESVSGCSLAEELCHPSWFPSARGHWGGYVGKQAPGEPCWNQFMGPTGVNVADGFSVCW